MKDTDPYYLNLKPFEIHVAEYKVNPMTEELNSQGFSTQVTPITEELYNIAIMCNFEQMVQVSKIVTKVHHMFYDKVHPTQIGDRY